MQRRYLTTWLAGLCLSLLAAAPPAMADPAEDRWKDAIFHWLATQAEPGRTGLSRLAKVPAIQSLMRHRYSCLRSYAYSANHNGVGSIYVDLVFASYAERFGDVLKFDGQHWIGTGCLPGACANKAIILAEQDTRQIHFALIHYDPWQTPPAANNLARAEATVSVFTDPRAAYPFSLAKKRLIEYEADIALGMDHIRLGTIATHDVTCARK